jgi:streptomycin 6-kinase
VLRRLAERWNLEWGDLIQRGSMSAVIRCAAEGQPAVLKVSPERTRVAHEAAALASWRTKHVPAVLAVDAALGALLIEAIEPGTPLADSRAYPNMESLVALLTSLHEDGASDPSYAAVADHITYLFDSGRKSYERRPDLAALIPPALNERGRQLALRLAADSPVRVLLHGDLTPANVLDGGSERGLVAVDPAPCVGDPAFDAVDLVFWRARDADEIATRAHQLAPAIGADARRLVEWCTAFAGMVALELAEAGNPPEYLEPLLVLSSRLWTTHRIPDPPRPQAN